MTKWMLCAALRVLVLLSPLTSAAHEFWMLPGAFILPPGGGQGHHRFVFRHPGGVHLLNLADVFQNGRKLLGKAGFLFVELTLPTGYHNCREAVANYINRSPSHVHQFINSKNDGHTDRTETTGQETIERRQQNY